MATSLLEINVDKLFEQHNIQDIDQIHKKLQNDVEQKKEELRTMVGERYRDLLKAADTIGHMKETASLVTGNVEGIMTCCRSLNEHQLIGFKTDTTSLTTKNTERSTNNFYGIAVQIKLLTKLPELIWSRIDEEDFFVATQLFIFARHISTGLHLDINKPIMKSFPVASRIWNILSSFYQTIKQSCLATLEREHLSADVASKCLASIFLLENSQPDRLLTTFIKLRTKSFKQILGESDRKAEQRVKDRILSSVRILIDTIILIYKCFVDFDGNDRGQLFTELQILQSAEAPPTISLISSECSMMLRLLPDIISSFKPNVNISELSEDTFKTIIQSWLQFTAQDAGNHLKILINAIPSIKTIYYIKTEAAIIEKPNQWTIMLEKLFLPPTLDLYKFYYQPLINERIEDIITTSWKEAVDGVHREVTDLLKSEQKSNKNNKSSFIWIEDPADIPLSLKQALSSDKHNHKLLLKSKGYTKGIVAICQLLDNKLKVLFDDLKLYLSHDGELKQVTSEKDSMKNVVSFLKSSSREGVLQLITIIKSSDFNKTQSNFILIATILQSLIDLCPHLKLCLVQDIAFGWDQLSSSNLEPWENVCALLEDESFHFWNLWIDSFVKELLMDNNACFTGAVNLIEATKEFTNWERITVEEKDEHDQPIESVIRVPSQPSVSLQTFLYRVCSFLHRSVPHMLPKSVTIALADRITVELQNTYQTLCTEEFIKSNQNASLQYFFDVKFINIIFGRTENKKLNEKFQKLSSQFKKNIDPFDFELFHKYLIGNIKKSAFRMQHKLGSIISNFEHLATVLGSNQQSQSLVGQEKEPNVLALSAIDPSTGWFSMLPVIVTGTSNTNDSNVNSEKSSRTKSKKQHQQQLQSSATINPAQNLANVRSGAAAFFGAMSQDWFR